MTRRDHGLSLIELVVAMAIFALIAIMGVQSLSSMLRMRDALVERDVQTTALGKVTAMMRNDLSAAIPMLFYPPDRAPPRSAVYAGGDDTFALSLAGQPSLTGDSRFHRANWRLDPSTQTLHRQVWSTLIPADTTARQPEVAVMTGVSALRLRTYWTGVGWIEGARNQIASAPQPNLDEDATGQAPEIYSDTLPLAIELTLTTVKHGDIVLIESLR